MKVEKSGNIARSLSENPLRRSYFGIVVAHGIDVSPPILFGRAKTPRYQPDFLGLGRPQGPFMPLSASGCFGTASKDCASGRSGPTRLIHSPALVTETDENREIL